jgi:hypothetical protein
VVPLDGQGCTDEQQHACHRHQQPQSVSPTLRPGHFDVSHDIPPNPTLGEPLFALSLPRLLFTIEHQPGHPLVCDREAVGQDEAAADIAIVHAVEKGWLIAEANDGRLSLVRGTRVAGACGS